MCGGCHANLDISEYSTEGLFQVIHRTMPLGAEALCVGQCAADVTAYVEQAFAVVAASCDTEDPVLYGERSLKLLTSYEYRNSVQDLFPGATIPEEHLQTPSDITIGSFPNNQSAVVTDQVGSQFYSNAEAIADWAIAEGLPFACDAKAACAKRFIEEFAPKAFRRPLRENAANEEYEISAFESIFEEAGTAAQGLRWAIVATLVSPNFLYRSELGVLVAEAKASGWETGGGSSNIDDYIAGADGVTVAGQDFTTKSTGGAENMDGTGGHNIWTTGSISNNFSFTDPAIVELNIRGSQQGGIAPNMMVSVGDEVIFEGEVLNEEYAIHTFLVTGHTGQQTLKIEFTNDAAPSGMEDRNLYVMDATVSPAELIAVDAKESSLELADDDAYVLDPYEYAATLSYMYTGSLPDAELTQAARTGGLSSEAGALAQIERMIESERGKAHVKNFVSTWMQTDRLFNRNFRRDPAAFTTDVRDSMAKEVQEFFWYIFDNEDVPFSDFYKANYTFLDATLADYYGIPRNGGSANEFVKVDTEERGGIVTAGAFLTTFAHPDQTSPILRAVRVRELMLCHHIDPPPALPGKRDQLANEVDVLKESGTLTTRVYYEKLTSDGECADCHDADINPLGGGMEDFDHVGLPRTAQLDVGLWENEVPIDADGALIGLNKLKGSDSLDFTGAKQLSTLLGDLEATKACFVEKAFRFGTGRAISPKAIDKVTRGERALTAGEVEDFGCAANMLMGELESNNESAKALYKKLGTLDLIRFRR